MPIDTHWEVNDLQWHTGIRPMQFIYRRLLENPAFFFVNNSEVGSRSDAEWVGLGRDQRFRVVHNVVAFSHLDRQAGSNPDLRSQLEIPDDARVIGGVFRLESVKRPMLWIETARLVLDRLPDAHFVIVGGGTTLDEVKDFAAKHGFTARLHMAGRVAEVGPWYGIMNVLLLTSEREGIPNVILEAQHFGVPIVATDVGGIGEGLDPGRTGRLVANASAESLAGQLIGVLTDAEWLESAKRQAPGFVHKHFGAESALPKIAEIYGW